MYVQNMILNKDPQYILLFILDCVRKDHLSVYKYKRKTSINLEELSKKSSIYNFAISPSTNTMGAVPSILTGKYPIELSNKFNGLIFSPEDFSNFKKLNKKGYKTAMFTANFITSSNYVNLNEYFNFFWDELTLKELNRNKLYQKANVVLEAVIKFIKNNLHKNFLLLFI